MPRFMGHKYQWTHPFTSTRHHWEVRSQHGGVHFHVQIMDDRSSFPDPSCGLELHSVTPFDDSAPHHLDCPVTGGRCWHEGTSLYASEHLWPMVKLYLEDGDHQAVFRMLESEHDRFFEDRGVLKVQQPEPELI